MRSAFSDGLGWLNLGFNDDGNEAGVIWSWRERVGVLVLSRYLYLNLYFLSIRKRIEASDIFAQRNLTDIADKRSLIVPISSPRVG